ncbi:hypothetical protein SNE40_011466 [Patella caerulea]|uniref:Putative hydroxypyruvate isomerase n=1 Tax=Patella caerulea TaxID=87958 RepID=A0AAN8PXU2_PATCE
MPLKFAANLSFMFQELPSLSSRYDAAKKAGFRFVETAFPFGLDSDELSTAKTKSGLDQVLINAYQGNPNNGDLGIGAIPGREAEFKEKLETSIQIAKLLQCTRMHIMAGLKSEFSEHEMEKTYLENLKYAAERLEKENMMALIEPINNRLTVPKYFLYDFDKAVEYIKVLNCPNLKLQLDLFHLQIMDGNLTDNIKKYLPITGHIQISQVPSRGEPDSQGEIDYSYILKLIDELGYDGYIGLEYKPIGDTVKGISWIKNLGYQM